MRAGVLARSGVVGALDGAGEQPGGLREHRGVLDALRESLSSAGSPPHGDGRVDLDVDGAHDRRSTREATSDGGASGISATGSPRRFHRVQWPAHQPRARCGFEQPDTLQVRGDPSLVEFIQTPNSRATTGGALGVPPESVSLAAQQRGD